MSFLIDHTPHWIKRTYFAPMMLAKLRERSYRKKHYHIDSQLDGDNVKQAVIFMIDGRFVHGGLSDRLWGAISSYQLCKKHGLDFKINWTYPFRLSTFLVPSTIDWRIDPKEVVYDSRFATPLFVNNNHNVNNQWRLLERIAHTGKKQVHVYSPSHIDRENFSKNFAELFKPSPLLAENIKKQKDAIGEDYISITFRFQQLLGDFKEGNYPTLPADEQEALLKRSIETIEEVKRLNPQINKVLVTSDSRRLLDAASKLQYVYIIPGELLHMSYTDGNESELNHLKAFLDFFMIAGAQKVYFAKAPGIYGSTFALTAAKVSDACYEEIDIK